VTGPTGRAAELALGRGHGEVSFAVVAPEVEQSASSRAISIHRPLRLREVRPRWYAVDGTPTDCAWLGIHHVLKGRRPRVLVSAINHGPNLADDVTYSGTLAFPGPGGRTPVSSAGGGSPTFSRSGRELFFVEGRQMMVAEIVPGSEMRVGVPRRLFEGAFVWERAGNFDVSVDGRRFLMIEAEQGELAGEARVVLNWFSDLRRLAPPGAR
jgi:hypothetical protein